MDGVAVDMSGRDHIANTIAELKGREKNGSNERQGLRKWHLEQLQLVSSLQCGVVLFTPNIPIGILTLRCDMQVGSTMGNSAGVYGCWTMSHPSSISVPLYLRVVLSCLTSKQTRQHWGKMDPRLVVLDYLITGCYMCEL
jgi:hypothetical protein